MGVIKQEESAHKLLQMSAPRRSPRLASKPPVKYVDEDSIIIEAIQELCDKENCTYYDKYATQFKQFMKQNGNDSALNSTFKVNRYAWTCNSLKGLVNFWATYHLWLRETNDNQLFREIIISRYTKAIYSYCQRESITYQPLMETKFREWIIETNPHIRSYSRPSSTIRKWIKTLKRTTTIHFT
jgi:hypothetical protein